MTHDEMIQRLREKKDPLELSIQKWTDIVEEKGFNEGLSNCALCELHLYKAVACKGCLIFEHTQSISCHDTPYTQFCNHVANCVACSDEVGGYCKSALELAKEEVAFLESIREEVKKKVKKYRVELCYSLYATPFEVEATDERDAAEKAVLAFNLSSGVDLQGGKPEFDHKSLARHKEDDMIEEVKEDVPDSN